MIKKEPNDYSLVKKSKSRVLQSKFTIGKITRAEYEDEKADHVGDISTTGFIFVVQ